MKLFHKKTVMDIMNPPEAKNLAKWSEENHYYINFMFDDGSIEENNYIFASALYFAHQHYPDANHYNIGSFAFVVSGYVTGMWGGFGMHDEPIDLQAENIIVALAGGIPSEPETGLGFVTEQMLSEEPGVEFTRRALNILVEFYFVDAKQAAFNLINSAEGTKDAVKLLLALARTQDEYNIVSALPSDTQKEKLREMALQLVDSKILN